MLKSIKKKPKLPPHSREKVLERLALGILPTTEEQELHDLKANDIIPIWMDGMNKEADKALEADRDMVRELLRPLGKDALEVFELYLKSDCPPEVDVAVSLAEQYYPKILRCVLVQELSNGEEWEGWEVLVPINYGGQRWKKVNPGEDWWIRELEDSNPVISVFDKPTRFPQWCRYYHKAEIILPAADMLLQADGCGKAEGVRLKQANPGYGGPALVTIHGVVGPWNFDPSDQTVDFEEGSRSFQFNLYFEKGVPCLARLLARLFALAQEGQIEKQRKNYQHYWASRY